jgi:hypothetical protein
MHIDAEPNKPKFFPLLNNFLSDVCCVPAPPRAAHARGPAFFCFGSVKQDISAAGRPCIFFYLKRKRCVCAPNPCPGRGGRCGGCRTSSLSTTTNTLGASCGCASSQTCPPASQSCSLIGRRFYRPSMCAASCAVCVLRWVSNVWLPSAYFSDLGQTGKRRLYGS